MAAVRKLFCVALGLLALQSVEACTGSDTDADLNPQPLPPEDSERSPGLSEGSDKNGSATASPPPSTPGAGAADAGGDAVNVDGSDG